MKKALITGASGFIGSHLAYDLDAAGFEVIALVNSNPLPSFGGKQLEQLRCDLRDRAAIHSILEKFSPQLIVHSAAISTGSACEKAPELAREVNIEATKNIASFYSARLEPAKSPTTLIYLSTDLVFEGAEAPEQGFGESDIPIPVSIYAKTKLEGEKVWNELGSKATIFRVCLCYGAAISSSGGPLAWMIESLRKETPVNLFFDEFRTPVYVKDISRAVCAQHQRRQAQQQVGEACEIFNLSGGKRLSRVELGRALAKSFGFSQDLIIEGSRKNLPGFRAANVSLSAKKLELELGISPSELEQALSEILSEIKTLSM